MSRRRDQSGDVAPLLVFAILLLVVAVLAAAIVVARRGGERTDPAAAPAPTAPPADHRLTDAEAIARFKELDALRRQAFEKKDLQLASGLYTREAPVRDGALQDIRKLIHNRVEVDIRSQTRRLFVRFNEPEEIRLRQIVVLAPRFVDVSKRDVTQSRQPERQVIDWVLRLERGQWLLHDAVVVAAGPVRSR